MTNSKQKGSRGERELRDLLKSFGLKARRTQQYSGTEGTSDVTCPDLDLLHIEVKRTENFKGYQWIEQAKNDSKGSIPTVWWRKNKKQWLVLMEAESLLTLLTSISKLSAQKKKKEETKTLKG
jgi:Holliday junction resolvase